MAATKDEAGIRFPPPLVYLGFLLLGFATGERLGCPGFRIAPFHLYLGGVLLAVGLAIIVLAATGFRRVGTNPEPWKPTTAIVETGLYRQTRNPMYVAMAIGHAGIALMLDSVAALLGLPIALFFIQTQVIAREERYLEAKFGDDYRHYKARVRRWL